MVPQWSTCPVFLAQSNSTTQECLKVMAGHILIGQSQSYRILRAIYASWAQNLRNDLSCKHTFWHLKLETEGIFKIPEKISPYTLQTTACIHLILRPSSQCIRVSSSQAKVSKSQLVQSRSHFYVNVFLDLGQAKQPSTWLLDHYALTCSASTLRPW